MSPAAADLYARIWVDDLVDGGDLKFKCDDSGGDTYRVSGLSCPEAQAYLTVIFHSFLHNNNINSDYILGANIYFTPHSIFSSYF